MKGKMKMSYPIMEALFYGHIIPWERRADMSDKHKAALQKIEIERNYFLGKLSTDDGQRFQKLEDLLMLSNQNEEVDIYTHGFTLGALLMYEVLEKKKAIRNP